MLFLYALGIPALLLLLTSLILPNRSAHKTHVVLLGLCLSLLTTSFLTDIFKNAIGRPRPDLIARCKPDPSTPHNTLVTIDVCTEKDGHLLQDGWRSYPSGHSSFAFAGLGWLSLFLASQTHCLRPRASHITVLLCLAPLVGAALIAISRLEDYRHDVFDVVSGSVLGAVVTTFNWRRYFPSLWASDCDEPYEPLDTERRGSGTTKRMRDEEEGYGAVSESERFGVGADGDDYRSSSR
jgi:diacylglycerol diphosphate phosphatase/phosphatidate phosphatase